MTKEMVVSRIMDASGNAVRVRNRGLMRRPRVLDLSKQEEIRMEIAQDGLTTSEDALLTMAFTENYWETLASLNARNQNLRRDSANERLNELLFDVKPDSLPIEFDLDFVSHTPPVISVGLVDRLGGRAWLPKRGAGYQKLIKLMFTLLTVKPKSDNVILIYDEPETSLHADAQHSFRSVLERFADLENFQVIYATHSPAMINPARPESLRLILPRYN